MPRSEVGCEPVHTTRELVPTIYTENKYMWALSLANVSISTSITIGDGTETRSSHPSEVRHLHFMTIIKSFYCPVTAYMYTLPLKEAIPFI